MSESHLERRPLAAEECAWLCPPEWIGFATTDELTPSEDLIGQERAVEAIRLGVRIRARGYNIYVSGPPGTGRTTTVRGLLHDEARTGPASTDLVYVHNFSNPRAPRLLRLPAGTGRGLQRALATVAERYRKALSALRASTVHRQRRDRQVAALREEQSRLITDFQSDLASDGLVLIEVTTGNFRRHELAAIVEDRPVPIEDLPTIVAEGKPTKERVDSIRSKHPQLEARLAEVSARIRELGRESEQVLAEIDRSAAEPLIDEALSQAREAIGHRAGQDQALDRYLDAVRGFLLNLIADQFASGDPIPSEGSAEGAHDPLGYLAIEVLVDRSGQAGRPVIEETNPTAARLLGWVEPPRPGEPMHRPDLTRLRAGAIHHADGGFLMLSAQDLLSEETAWALLRRALRAARVELQTPEGGEGVPPLNPDPLEVDVTVVMIGSPALREAMVENDEEFPRLFKVTAQFDDRVALSQEQVLSIARFLKLILDDEQLPRFSGPAVARLIECMVRVADGFGRVSTRYRLMADLAREAAWFCREAHRQTVEPRDIEAVLVARRHRHGLLSHRIQQSIQDGVLMLDLAGSRIGQVNALAVIETNLERFGYPMRVTATTAVGQQGIIDIEREADLSGEIHTKASLILAGYLRSRFAQRQPLAITASICFEQSYGGVEGDSASSAELVALLSSLADAPLRQDIAVTGAVDQRGQILPVGGLNEKIEGFWDVCCRRQIQAPMGVVIPAVGVGSLQLDRPVLEAIQAGKLQVHAASCVEDVVWLLAGLPLGEADSSGAWPEGTLGARISLKLTQMAEAMRSYRPE